MVMMWQSAVWWIMQLGGLNLQKILIIEDDVTISRLMESILGKTGYDTESAFTGQDGISMALQEDYSLILMDLMLPGKTGEDIIRELRNHLLCRFHARVPFCQEVPTVFGTFFIQVIFVIGHCDRAVS